MCRQLLVLSVMIMLILANYSSVFACACCADKGEYSISTGKPDSYLLSEFTKMRFAKLATLFTSDAGIEKNQVKGLPKDYNEENYQANFDKLSVEGGYRNNQWKFSLTDYQGRKGDLILPKTVAFVRFAVDLEPDNPAPNHSLYKEWRFQGNIKATGFLSSSITTNTKYFLVFRGNGNACDNASDFDYWRLEIKGSKASYAFWGKMEK